VNNPGLATPGMTPDKLRRMTYSAHRPKGFRKQGDSHLREIVRKLRRALLDVQRDFTHYSLRLDAEAMGNLAGILVDFAEDIHGGTRIWEAYEQYNRGFFGTTLPLTVRETGGGPATGFHPDRFQHFLWVLYPALIGGLAISPAHQDLRRIAEASSAFLAEEFSVIPRDSGVKALLAASDEHGWDVKRKLIWLGSHSFLFRTLFDRHMDQNGRGKSTIANTDDFICQVCTPWSGLGAIDILASVLDISNDDRADLRSWYERHAAFYRVDAAHSGMLQAVNIINDQPYQIRMNMERNPFERGQLIFGSLVPWRGEWYWSGMQQNFGDASKLDAGELISTMKRKNSSIVCRYSKEYAALVRERTSDLHAKTLAYYGKDLIVYPDGLSMAADWEKELRWNWESQPRHEIEEAVKKYGLEKGRAEMNLPRDLLEHKGGLGVFLNPEQGKEIFMHFTDLIAGLRKKGQDLTDEEVGVIGGFIDSTAVSPRFVRRMVTEYGDESIRSAFLLKGELPGYWLDYLLRSHKGGFYRNRYPSLSVV
jgi:hypothetical protein